MNLINSCVACCCHPVVEELISLDDLTLLVTAGRSLFLQESSVSVLFELLRSQKSNVKINK